MVGKIKGKTASIAVEAFVGLKPKIYSFFVDDNSENKIGTHEINKLDESSSCFDDKTYIRNNGYDGLALRYQKKTVIFVTIQKQLF